MCVSSPSDLNPLLVCRSLWEHNERAVEPALATIWGLLRTYTASFSAEDQLQLLYKALQKEVACIARQPVR